MSRFLGVCLSVLTIAGVCAPSTAAADGLPVGNVDAGPGGVASRSGDVRYVTVPATPNTLALSIRRNGGQVLRSKMLRGRYAVPVVALDGTADGLSADGRTLVLIQPRAGFPRARTTFAIIDTQRMRTRAIVRLRGDFSFDAMSPGRGARVPDPVHVAPRSDPLRRARLRHAHRSPAPRSDHRSARVRAREDARLPDHAGDEPGRPVGLHALRRRREASRSCTR